jgi:Na+-driven multidrug efflux pump
VALATVIVQVIGTIYMTFKVIQSPIFEFKRFLKEHFSSTASKNILRQGLPSSLNMTTIALGVFVINYFILLYGNNSTIAGYGAAVRIEQLVLLPALGLNIAVLTITGQSYGAENLQRIKDIYKISIQIGVVIMLTGSVIIYPFAPLLIKIFNNDPAVIEAGTTYLRIEVLAFASYVFLFNGVASMQGIKKPNFAVFIGLYRQIILPVILFFLMGTVFNLGIKGIWFAIVIINWSAVLITSLYHSHLIRNIKFN